MSVQDGGAAFPVWSEPGMSLRDWFAGQALAGLMVGGSPVEGLEHHAANSCYRLADAMLAARGLSGGTETK